MYVLGRAEALGYFYEAHLRGLNKTARYEGWEMNRVDRVGGLCTVSRGL